MSSNEARLNVLLVDDEIEACRNLKSILLEYIDPHINILGIAHNTKEAERQLELHNPDVVFLDIEMPNENAFQFLERVAPIHFEVIFVTAYDEYAIKAFKLNAVDYILKPISISELANAVTKLKERLKFKAMFQANNPEFGEVSKQITSRTKLNRIVLKGNNNVEIVAFTDIIYIEANGGYSKVFFVKGNHLVDILTSYSIAEYEELLPDSMFFRVHKSYLINHTHIKKINKDFSMHLILYDAINIPISRRRYPMLVEYLKTQPGFHEQP